MDADYSMVDNRERNTFDINLFVPWDAPVSVVDVFSAGVVPLRCWVVKKMRQRVISYKIETLVVSVCLFRMDGGSTRIFMK